MLNDSTNDLPEVEIDFSLSPDELQKVLDKHEHEDLLAWQHKVAELWQADSSSAKALGEARLEVKKRMKHGDFGMWLQVRKIDRNRANYCIRVASGKVPEKKKQSEQVLNERTRKQVYERIRKLWGPEAYVTVVDSTLRWRCSFLAQERRLTLDALITELLTEYENRIQFEKLCEQEEVQ